MLETLTKVYGLSEATRGENPHAQLIMEGFTDCNRACVYCNVRNRQNTERFSTLAEAKRQIDEQYRKGYRFYQYVGGESLAESKAKGEEIYRKYHHCEHGVAVCGYIEEQKFEEEARFRTDEGITYADHAISLIDHASRLGMVTNIITNGDFVELRILKRLKQAGLDFINFSLHSPSEAGIKDIIGKARAASNEGLISVVSLVYTEDRTDAMIKVANTCAANGIFFSTSLVQEIGEGFSSKPLKSQVPSIEQIMKVFPVLLERKESGYVINNVPYLKRIMQFSEKPWKCNPEKDSFLHIRSLGEKGEVGVCSELRSGFDGSVDLNSKQWREKKRTLVEACPGCSYSCYFQAENSDPKGDLRTLINMALIKAGQARLVRWLGRRSVRHGEIVNAPKSYMEKWQEEDRISGRAKAAGKRLLEYASTPLVYAVAFGVFGLLCLIAKREGYSASDATEALNMRSVYPGFGDMDVEPGDDEPEEIDTSKLATS